MFDSPVTLRLVVGIVAWLLTPPGVRNPLGVISPGRIGMRCFSPVVDVDNMEGESPSVDCCAAKVPLTGLLGLRPDNPCCAPAAVEPAVVDDESPCLPATCASKGLRSSYMDDAFGVVWSCGPVGQKPLSMLAIFEQSRR